jgi:outer membrane protein assembly factor BamB
VELIRPDHRRRLRFLTLTALSSLSVACAGDVIGELPSPPTPAFTASPSAEADEGILAEIAVDGSPCFLTEAADRIWVSAFDGDELLEIDPETNELVGEHRIRGGPCGMFVHDGTLWVETGTGLAAFDPTRGREVGRIRIPGGVFGVQDTPSGFWGVAGEGEQLLQIDPDARRVVGRVDVEGPLFGLAFARGQLWLGTLQGLVRIDPQTGTVVETIELESFEPQGLTPDGDVLWISSGLQGTVLRFDMRTMRVRDRLDVDDDSLFGGIVVGDSYWVSGNNGTVFRLDAGTGDVVDQFDLVGFGPMPADGDLWTVDFLSNTVFRLDERAA